VYYVSCKTSTDEFSRTISVNPPIVNRNTVPSDHKSFILAVLFSGVMLCSLLEIQ
jgi:hypothetical protein